MIFKLSYMSTSLLLSTILFNYTNRILSLQMVTEPQQVEDKLNSFMNRKDNFSFERTITWFKRLQGKYSICGLPDDEKLNLCYWCLDDEDEFDDESFTKTDCQPINFEYALTFDVIDKKSLKISMYKCPLLLQYDPSTGDMVEDDREICISRVDSGTDQAIAYVRNIPTAALIPRRYLYQITKKELQTRRPKSAVPRSINRSPPRRIRAGLSSPTARGGLAAANAPPNRRLTNTRAQMSPARSTPASPAYKTTTRSFLPIRDIGGKAFFSAASSPAHPRASASSSSARDKPLSFVDRDASSSSTHVNKNDAKRTQKRVNRPFPKGTAHESSTEFRDPRGASASAQGTSDIRPQLPIPIGSVDRSRSDHVLTATHADDVRLSEMWPYREEDQLKRGKSYGSRERYSDPSDSEDKKAVIETQQALLLEKVRKHKEDRAGRSDSAQKRANEKTEAQLMAEPDKLAGSTRKNSKEITGMNVRPGTVETTVPSSPRRYADQSANQPIDNVQGEIAQKNSIPSPLPLRELPSHSLENPQIRSPGKSSESAYAAEVGARIGQVDPSSIGDEFSFPSIFPAPSASAARPDIVSRGFTQSTIEVPETQKVSSLSSLKK